MKKLNVLLLGLGLTACANQERDAMSTGSGAGEGDSHLGRRVTGVYLLSTDYHYDEPCNYLPEEFVRNLFQVSESVEFEKSSELHSCEFRWGSNRIGFHLESEKPFESVFQSEYHFNKLFQPNAKPVTQQDTIKKPVLSGPDPQGTGAEVSARMEDTTPRQDSTRGADPSGPIEGMTSPAPPLVEPAKNTATGQAVNRVGDKAIWEPGKKSLHVLFNNHVFSVVANMPGDTAKIKQGAIGLARQVIYMLNDNRDPRE
ncbi:hypothetical protein GCM10027592_16210 [Spirosoma flavus]